MQQNKYWRSLLGEWADVLIGKATAYSDSATYEHFINNAVEGEIGVYNKATGALISGAGAVANDLEVFVALKRDGAAEITPTFTTNGVKKSRVAYAAAVQQVSTATFTGTPTAKNFYSVKILETTPGSQPFPTWEYPVVAATGETITTLAQKIRDLINDKTNIINKDTDSIVTATASAGVLTITGSKNATFKIAFSAAALEDLAATAAYTGGATAKAYQGNGTYAQIAYLEQLSDVLKGVTTNYPDNAEANPEDFGKPTVFATAGVNYHLYMFTFEKTEKSPTPVEKHFHTRKVLLAIPTASGPETEIKAIFAL